MKKFLLMLLLASLAFVGCDDDDDDDDNSTTTTTTTTSSSSSSQSADDSAEVAALNVGGGDPHGLISLYGGVATFANLPVNFQVANWSSNGVNVTIPEGEANLDPLGEDHMLKRRALVLAISGNNVIQTEDFAYDYNSHIGRSYGAANKVLVIHCKSGAAVSRTALTDV